MMDSAIMVGGWPAFWGALLVGFVSAQLMPGVSFGARCRWFVFWMMWCSLTPVRPWEIDLPLMILTLVLLEWTWHKLWARTSKTVNNTTRKL